METVERKIVWNKRAEKDFLDFPDDVKASFRQALEEARQGTHPAIADPYGAPLGSGVYKLKDSDWNMRSGSSNRPRRPSRGRHPGRRGINDDDP